MRASIGLLLCCVLTALSAYPEDRAIQVAEGLHGKLYLPDGAGTSKRAVLMLHGFNSHMDEVGDLYALLADHLGNRGIASLRIDFSGEGARVNHVVTSTLDSRIRESELSFEYLRTRFPEASIGVQGFSLGGLTAMAVAGKHPDWFQTMVLWSAAESNRGEPDIAYSKAAQQAIREGKAVYQTWADITLTREHLASFVGVDVSLTLSRYPGAFLSIRGDHDFLAPNDRKWLSLLPTTDKSFILIGGADHTFNVLENPKPAYGQRVLVQSTDWFDRTLTSR